MKPFIQDEDDGLHPVDVTDITDGGILMANIYDRRNVGDNLTKYPAGACPGITPNASHFINNV